MKILHVVESFGGGVATAVEQYAKSTPEFEHHLLRSVRDGEFGADPDAVPGFASVRSLPRNALAAMRCVRSTAIELRPGVVHAHSSWGGLFVRLAIRSRPNRLIVYTPHGFAFVREDIGAILTGVFLIAERLLARNTDTIAGCSTGEVSAALDWHSRSLPVLVPNHSDDVLSYRLEMEEGGPRSPRVAACGRLSTVKDPSFFAEVIDLLRVQIPDVSATWYGGGGDSETRALTDHGIAVSGWQSRAATLEGIANSDVYVHTARWEAFPLSVLEAGKLQRPIVVRDIDAFRNAAQPIKAKSPAEVAEKVLQLLTREDVRLENLRAWGEFLVSNTAAAQKKALLTIYARSGDAS